ncbi:MAG: hypothetical protein JEY79_13450 [Pseudodesulfovibrio sp.]|nr:hypothetical protein [Pseudodesulfovibrio sp.]
MIANDAVLFFAGELAELLTYPDCAGIVRYPVGRRASIKDVIEAMGVPHAEVYAIHSRGVVHDFGLLLEHGMSVALLPAGLAPEYPVDVTLPTILRPTPFDSLRFLVDENVAGLVPLLRALGFDTVHDRFWSDEEMAERAVREGRVVLSRSRALLKRTAIVYGRLIRTQVVEEQLLEVLGHFRISSMDRIFSRCLCCNEVLKPVDKKEILERLEPKTRKYFDDFMICSICDRIFWRGSHHQKLMERFARLGIMAGPEAGQSAPT